jgi:hypothetical protein
MKSDIFQTHKFHCRWSATKGDVAFEYRIHKNFSHKIRLLPSKGLIFKYAKGKHSGALLPLTEQGIGGLYKQDIKFLLKDGLTPKQVISSLKRLNIKP